jgi:integral membrane sensor domain MASE1
VQNHPSDQAALRRLLLTLSGVAVTYFVAARLGLQLSLVERTVSPLWPPTGVALVAFLAFGRRMWPAVLLSAFAINATLGPPVPTAAIIAVGNTLAPLLAAELLQRAGFRTQLDRVRDALALVFLGANACLTLTRPAARTAGGASCS